MDSKDTVFFVPQFQGNLNNKQIEERDQIIKSVNNYDIFFHLKKDNYNGRVIISIDFLEEVLKNKNSHSLLLIEYEGKSVNQVSVQNDDDMQNLDNFLNYSFNNHIISIKISDILPYIQKSLKNFKISIDFENKYSKTKAEGMVKYSENNNDYIYCQGEVACTNWIFPCIDSVNFRSNYKIQVQHPSKWVISSHKKISNQEQIENNETITTFPIVNISFPTYLFGLYAGDYQRYYSVFRDNIELNIFCRQEFKEILDKQANEYFNKVQFALNFMEQYTNVKYFLEKFDVFFCPHYKDYGMETLGCISLDEEEYLEEPNECDFVQKFDEMEKTEILFHEIVHQWFGNYVSIKWWNDLYIKEGFANFLSGKIMEQYYSKLNIIGFQNIINQFDFLKDDLKSKFNVVHKKLPYEDYVTLCIHSDITYLKACSLFQMLENNMYGNDAFQAICRNILNDNKEQSINSEDLKRYFDDPITKKYLSSKGFVYFDGQDLKKLCRKGTFQLGKEELDTINITVFVINKEDLSYELKQLKELKVFDTKKYIYILNSADNLLIYQSVDEEALEFIDENKLMLKYDEKFRISIWKSLLFLCEIDEWDNCLNTFFINNILYESNDSIFQLMVEQYIFFCDEFTKKDEKLIISKIELAQSEKRKNILIYYLIDEYICELSNLQALEKSYRSKIDEMGKHLKERFNKRLNKRLQ